MSRRIESLIEFGVAGSVDPAHPARPELFDDLAAAGEDHIPRGSSSGVSIVRVKEDFSRAAAGSKESGIRPGSWPLPGQNRSGRHSLHFVAPIGEYGFSPD